MTTAYQFTDEYANVEADAKRWWLALWRAWRKVASYARMNGAKPGERLAKGWAE